MATLELEQRLPLLTKAHSCSQGKLLERLFDLCCSELLIAPVITHGGGELPHGKIAYGGKSVAEVVTNMPQLKRMGEEARHAA